MPFGRGQEYIRKLLTVSDGQPVRTIDADSLDRCVLDVQIGDGRVGKVMGVEELGLRHAARATLAIPVL